MRTDEEIIKRLGELLAKRLQYKRVGYYEMGALLQGQIDLLENTLRFRGKAIGIEWLEDKDG